MTARKTLVFFLLVFFITTAYAAEETSAEEKVVKFRNFASISSSLNYNFMAYEQSSSDYSLMTNRPWDLGIGIGLLSLSIGFTFSLPFLYDQNHEQSQSFDINMNIYHKKSFTYAYFKFYSGFNDGADYNTDLTIINAALTWTRVFNDDHSLRSVYNLDRRQTVSNGSFLLGGGMYLTSIQANNQSDNTEFENFRDGENALYLGPSAGFSYTFVFRSNCFINVMSTFGVNIMISGWNTSSGFQALPRFTFGYHGKKWSANIYSKGSYLIAGDISAPDYNIFTGNVGLSFVRRFGGR
ncbi:MAG: DUF4421 domain-containing protein [Treponema sp.]|jgi:hypothetical protein|nr:DUF4421 domain-containing protein [Treponema sp.]